VSDGEAFFLLSLGDAGGRESLPGKNIAYAAARATYKF